MGVRWGWGEREMMEKGITICERLRMERLGNQVNRATILSTLIIQPKIKIETGTRLWNSSQNSNYRYNPLPHLLKPHETSTAGLQSGLQS